MWCYIVPSRKHHCMEKEKCLYCSGITALSLFGGYWSVCRHEGPGLFLGLLSVLYLWSIKWPWDSYLAEDFSFAPFTDEGYSFSSIMYVALTVAGAGYMSPSGRSCDRPSRHRFCLVSLCLRGASRK